MAPAPPVFVFGVTVGDIQKRIPRGLEQATIRLLPSPWQEPRGTYYSEGRSVSAHSLGVIFRRGLERRNGKNGFHRPM